MSQTCYLFTDVQTFKETNNSTLTIVILFTVKTLALLIRE